MGVIFYKNKKYTGSGARLLSELLDVLVSNPSNGQVPVYNSTSGKWENSSVIDNKLKVSTFQVTCPDPTDWVEDTTSQSGSTLYKKQITLNHIYVDSPSVEIGAASGRVLPTTSQQESYDLILYATSDDTVPCLYLYASDIPQTAFYINVEGCD